MGLVARNYQNLLHYATPERFEAVLKRVYDAACDGDINAARFLITYWCGKPPEEISMKIEKVTPQRLVINLPDWAVKQVETTRNE